jgi:hypothetical protein
MKISAILSWLGRLMSSTFSCLPTLGDTSHSLLRLSQDRSRWKNLSDDDTDSLIRNVLTQWHFGEWGALVKVELVSIENHERRDLLALLVASAHLQLGHDDTGRTCLKTALAWGCDKTLVAHVLLAGAENSLGKAYLEQGNEGAALQAMRSSLLTMNFGGDLHLLQNARAANQVAHSKYGQVRLEDS